MDPLWDDVGRCLIYNRINTMDNGCNKELVEKINRIEEDIFEGKSIDIREFYRLKKELIDNKSVHGDLLELFLLLEAMLDKSNNELMNKRLNLLTIWSTIFLPLSFYTGLWGMNFDDIPFLNGDHGFYVFTGLTLVTVFVMYKYFKRNKWL